MLTAKKYEIENHFTHREWLKVYAGAVQDYNLDMEGLIQGKKDPERSSLYEGKWNVLSEYAQWLAEVEEGID